MKDLTKLFHQGCNYPSIPIQYLHLYYQNSLYLTQPYVGNVVTIWQNLSPSILLLILLPLFFFGNIFYMHTVKLYELKLRINLRTRLFVFLVTYIFPCHYHSFLLLLLRHHYHHHHHTSPCKLVKSSLLIIWHDLSFVVCLIKIFPNCITNTIFYLWTNYN